jgi:hypothetical protein
MNRTSLEMTNSSDMDKSLDLKGINTCLEKSYLFAVINKRELSALLFLINN